MNTIELESLPLVVVVGPTASGKSVLAVELAIELERNLRLGLAVAFFVIGVFFAWRSFYAMRIKSGMKSVEPKVAAKAA